MPRMGRDTFVRIRLSSTPGSYLLLPSLTATQRDALAAENGMVIYQSTTGRIECYESGGWKVIGQVYGDATFLKLSGGTMSGNIAMGSNKVTGLAAPSANGEAARKEYVDDAVALYLPLAGGALTGNVTVTAGKTIDGVDISAHAADGNAHTQGGNVLFLPLDYNAVVQGTWSINSNVAHYLAAMLWNSSDANGDNITFLAYLPAGTYTLQFITDINNICAIIDFDIDGVEVASFDTYNATEVDAQTKTQTGIVVATSGLKTIKMRVDGRNASASGWRCNLEALTFWRTA